MKSLYNKASTIVGIILLSVSILATAATNSSSNQKTDQCVIGQPQNC